MWALCLLGEGGVNEVIFYAECLLLFISGSSRSFSITWSIMSMNWSWRLARGTGEERLADCYFVNVTAQCSTCMQYTLVAFTVGEACLLLV